MAKHYIEVKIWIERTPRIDLVEETARAIRDTIYDVMAVEGHQLVLKNITYAIKHDEERRAVSKDELLFPDVPSGTIH